jgi:phosphoribosylanthranilate isomerase
VPEFAGSSFVKICGVTTVADARDVVASGADALGLIFATSPRQVSPEKAREILAATDGSLLRCAVFRDVDSAELLSTLDAVETEIVQIHGELNSGLLTRLRERELIVVKALNVEDEEFDVFDESSVDAVLVDGPRPGSGVTHSWSRLAERSFSVPLIVAGGLTPVNVASAISTTKAWGVDSASGVERAPGLKDPDLVTSFVANARRAFGTAA